MKRALVLIPFLAACASSAPSTSPSPAPAPPAVIKEAPKDWHLLDITTDGVPGISLRKAERELLAGKQPKRPILVAVIDNGVDTSHVDLRANLWTNGREIAGNGKDDDGNGYVDDVRGWDFIGGRDGRNVDHDTFEVTRLYKRCGAGNAIPDSLPAADKQQCAQITQEFIKKRDDAERSLANIRQIGEVFARITPVLKQAVGGDSLDTEKVEALKSTNPEVQQARGMFLRLAGAGISPSILEEARKSFEGQVEYSLNPNFDPRPIVGDNPTNLAERNYGNADVTGPGPKHGTHVSGIIGAVRDNGVGIDGIAPAVRIMAVRAVPDGDERDKDIANAIRYAADNGAQVISMSFGKAYSPQKSVVDDAVRYADSKGILMVHAAGNEGQDTGKNASFPTPVYLSGGRAQNWIEVGASSWRRDSLPASFSNFSQQQVDVFAPGVDIYSTVPKGYEKDSGTSMAAPVVSGLAALIMSYYPNLTAPDVKRIILQSASKYPNLMVLRPGTETGEKVDFSTLSATGGVVNAYAALKLAEEQSKIHP